MTAALSPRIPMITFDEWVERYGPLANPLDRNAGLDSFMLETYGGELELARAAHKRDPAKVWTVLDVDGDLWIAPGWHHVNRMGYAVSEKPCEDERLQVCDDPEVFWAKARRTGGITQAKRDFELSSGMQEALDAMYAATKKTPARSTRKP